MESPTPAVLVSDAHVKGLRLWATILALSLGTLLVAIDNTIIAVAIPEISSVFNALDQVGWYGSAYLLTVTALQPTCGRLYKYFDMKYSFLCSVIVFEVGSVLCATAPRSAVFIVGRAVLGIGAAGILQGGLAIIGAIIPLEKRPLYISIVLSVFGLATCFGPVLGGAFTTGVSWRWCFYINLPIGFVSFILILLFLDRSSVTLESQKLHIIEKWRRLDIVGAAILSGGLCCLLLALQWAGDRYPWRSPQVIGLFTGSGLILVLFFVIQWRLGRDSTIPLHVLSQRSVLSGSAFELFINMSNYTIGYYLPFYFQAVQLVTATDSGVRFIALAFPEVLAIVLVGVIVTRFGIYVPFMLAGTAVAIVGTSLLSRIGYGTPTVEWAAYSVVTGVGIGFGIQLPYTGIQAVLDEDDLPSGNGILLLFQQLGGAIAIPIGNTILVASLLTEVPENTRTISPEEVINAGAGNLKTKAANPTVLHALQLSYSTAVANTLYLALATVCLALIFACGMEWRNIKDVANERKQLAEAGNSTQVKAEAQQ